MWLRFRTSRCERTESIALVLIALHLLAGVAPSCGGGNGGTNREDPLVIQTSQLSPATVGQPYSAQLSAVGGAAPYRWSIASGNWPPGLSLAQTSGAITGTPNQEGSFSFTIEVTDSSLMPAQAALQSLTMAIAPGPLTITTESLSGAKVGFAYGVQLQVLGGVPAYTWSVVEGALPLGLELGALTGGITGTPTTAATYSFSVQVKDAAGNTATRSLSLTVLSPPVPLPASACVNNTYGACGDPYEGQPPPSNPMPLSACNTSISAGGNYFVTQDLGSDATQICLKFSYPSDTFNLDLGGHTITGCVEVQTNHGNNVIFNGLIDCNGGQSGAALFYTVSSGRIHHIVVQNSNPGGGFNILVNAAGNFGTTPLMFIDHVASTVPATPNVNRTRNIAVDGGNTIAGTPTEISYNYITCSDNASACQGVELYNNPYGYVHHNYFVLPTDCSLCKDSARAGLYDAYSGGDFSNNTVIMRGNRGVRVRSFPCSQTVNIHDNLFTDIVQSGRKAAVHVGENDNNLSDIVVNIYNNSFELGPGGNGVLSIAATNVTAYNNTVTCLGGNCSGAGYFALTDAPYAGYALTGTTLYLKNNNVSALTSAGRPAVLACGSGAPGPYTCSDTSSTTAATVCNSGTAIGTGTITSANPPCP